MKKAVLVSLAFAGMLAASSVQANDAVVGAVIGGGMGGLIGQSVGGRDGAVMGGLVGAIAGAALASNSGPRYAHAGYGAPVYYAQPRHPVYHAAPAYYGRPVVAAPVYYHGRPARHHHRHERHGHHHKHRHW